MALKQEILDAAAEYIVGQLTFPMRVHNLETGQVNTIEHVHPELLVEVCEFGLALLDGKKPGFEQWALNQLKVLNGS